MFVEALRPVLSLNTNHRMPSLPFLKMQAQGNDFVILDGRSTTLPALNPEFISEIAERRYGIGCDQVLVLLPDDSTETRLRVFNNDGSEAENCGNGLRCIGHILLNEKRTDSVNIRLHDRTVRAEKSELGVRAHMGPAKVSTCTKGHIDIDLGNPHSVFFAATEDFPQDRNVEIVSGQIGNDVYIDIIERGSGHTQACGSGACAVAAAIWHREGHSRAQNIHMPGGDIRVSGSIEDIVLEGSVKLVFSGYYEFTDQS